MATGPDDWSAGGFRPGRHDVEGMLNEARAGRSGYPVVRGDPWW